MEYKKCTVNGIVYGEKDEGEDSDEEEVEQKGML